jgi:intracellular septation protein
MISLLEWLPLTVFFIAYHYLGLYAATAGIMIASIVQLALYTIQGKSISLFQWVSLLFLGVMGSATLFFKNVLFIKWKPTLVYWLFSSACLLSPYYSKTNLVQHILGSLLTLPDVIWKRLNYYWALCFALLGLTNILVAYSVSTPTWVTFKLFGLFGIQLLFIIVQTIYLTYFNKIPYESS